MKTLINLINDINRNGLRINNVKFDNYNIVVETHYQQGGDLIVNKIVFDNYEGKKLLDWHKVSNNYIKEGWNSQNHHFEYCFEFFLNLIKRLKKEKGITEEQITDKLDLITFTKKIITFQYSHYEDFKIINFYLEGQTELGLDWERTRNKENEFDLIRWIIKGY